MYDLVSVTFDNYQYFKNLISGHIEEIIEDDKSIFMVGVLNEAKAVGIAILKPEPLDMISLIYIYVDEKQRNKGIGGFLLNSLTRLCFEEEKLLTCTFFDDNDFILYDIFDKSGDFVITKENGIRCSISLGEIVDATSDTKIDKFRKSLIRYENLPGGKRNIYLDSLIQNNILNMKYKQASFNKKYSYCCLDKNGEIAGTIIIENLSENNFSVRLLHCKKNYEIFVIPLIIECARTAMKDLPYDTLIHMDMITDESANFVKKLLPSIQIDGGYYTAVMDDTEWGY